MELKEFVRNFNYNQPDWNSLPDKFPNCDLGYLSSTEISQFNSIKTLWELNLPKILESNSRVWKDPKGYQYLGVWQNASLLRILVRKFTSTLPLSPTLKNPYQPFEHRLKAQLDDAARSVVRNIEEGYKRPTTKEYLQFLGYSQASLEEVKGDIRDAKTDKFLLSQPLSTLRNTLNIDLRVIKGKDKGLVNGDPASNTDHPYYKPLATLNPKTLTFEIFMELINKTDYLLRSLVLSLEKRVQDNKIIYGKGVRY